MKRIIDGVTYNTATSTLLAKSEYEAQYNHVDYPCVGWLYQTRGGAFFIHEEIDLGPDENGLDVTRDRASAKTADQAQAWLMTGDVEVFHNPFDDPPDAAAETEPSATIYVRVPASLKQRLEQSAKADKLSGNAWAIRCIERCLVPKAGELDWDLVDPEEEYREQFKIAWFLAKEIESNNRQFTPAAMQKLAGALAGNIETGLLGLGVIANKNPMPELETYAKRYGFEMFVNEIVEDAS